MRERREPSPLPPGQGALDIGVRNPQISQKSLAIICRSMGTMLHSGIDVQKALQMTAAKLSDRRAATAMEAIHGGILQRGEIAEAMRDQGKRFPPLMIDLVEVGEQTGSLPEVFNSLSRHYETNVRLKREFVGQIAWPVFQFVAAVLVIALVIYVLGILQGPNTDPDFRFDIFGLAGASGAISWLFMTFGTVGLVFAGYKVFARTMAGQQFLDPLLMRIPVLGYCMRSFAIARFSWAFALTQQSGMGIKPSIHQSMKATSNGAFLIGLDTVWNEINSGEVLADALAASRLFPEEFIQTVHVAETSGTVPEALDRLSPRFEEDAQRSLRALTSALGWGIWVLVAIFIIVLIFKIVLQYVGMLNSLT